MRQAPCQVLSESVIYSRRRPGDVQAAVIPIQQTGTLRLREAEHRAQAPTPCSVVQTGLIRAWTLTVVPSNPLCSRGSRIHHGIPDGGSIRKELAASPLGHLVEPLLLESSAPRAGLPCPSPTPSLLIEHSWGLPAGPGQPFSSSGSSVPGSPSAGHSRAAPSPWGW